MKVAICSSFLPFNLGGARNIVDWLESMLEEAGHQVEKIYLPHVDTPELIIQQKMAYRWIDLDCADRIICFRPPAHVIPHPNKILWFIHHIRIFYDLWESYYLDIPKTIKYQGIRDALHAIDTAAIKEAKKVYTNSQVTSDRLKKFNNIESEVLYPPVFLAERFKTKEYNQEVVCVCRIEHHKRQHLLVEAMQYVKSPIVLRLCGPASNPYYVEDLITKTTKWNLKKRVIIENHWISEEAKVEILSRCLAVAYLPMDEDSYGYPSLEASHASKAILTTADSGAVLELVEDGINGYVSEPYPKAIAAAMDQFYLDKDKTKKMGLNARARLNELNINWSHVIERLLA